MKITYTTVGQSQAQIPEEQQWGDWPEGLPCPREGETVTIASWPLTVRRVVHYPFGEVGEDTAEPFVYLVLD